MNKLNNYKIEQIDAQRFRIPKTYKPGMQTDGIIYADEQLIDIALEDKAIEQLANITFLPGIVKEALAMPDLHWGYGFPIGGVAATDIDKSGVISPGGVGFDINCGVRLLKTGLFYDNIRTKIPDLIKGLYHIVPAGVGSAGQIKLKEKQLKTVLIKGAKWAIEQGFGTQADLEATEEQGCFKGADPEQVSSQAYKRGSNQIGTLGSGNHFLEIQLIDTIFDLEIANNLQLSKGQIVIMLHSGSRGFGHQVCTDYVKVMHNCLSKYGFNLPDHQLACAPVHSKEGQAYFAAMKCAANYAWANRQVLTQLTRDFFEKFFKTGQNILKMDLIYDVAHNIAKIEDYFIDNDLKKLCVHRKGATRAFGPGHKDIPAAYKTIGQPVIIPGDMGTNSYLLVGTKKAEAQSFGSANHGAGRVKSRSQALKTFNPDMILASLKKKGIVVCAAAKKTIIEEAPQAYKDINSVVEVIHNAGIAKKVCRMRPLAVIKG
ncbi:MAG: RtcB family protein [Candidatus Omnitrophota bacterium]